MRGHRFRNGRRGDRDQIGGGADLKFMMSKTELACSGACDKIKGERQISVGAKILAVANHHSPLEHVAISIGRPSVAYIVRAGENPDTCRDEALNRRHRHGPGSVGHDCDVGRGQSLGCAAKLYVVNVAERKGMTDRHSAPKPKRRCAHRDLTQFETAERARIV